VLQQLRILQGPCDSPRTNKMRVMVEPSYGSMRMSSSGKSGAADQAYELPIIPGEAIYIETGY